MPLVRVVIEPEDALSKLRGRVANQKPVLEAVGILARREFAENFVRQGRPAQWQRLSPGYEAAKRQMHSMGEIRGRNPRTMHRVRDTEAGSGAMPGILIRTGALKDSYSRRGHKGNVHNISADGRTLTVGSNVEYAHYHEDGTQGGKVIRAKPGGVLAWYGIDPKTGQEGMVFRKKVVMKPLAKRQVMYLSPEAYDKIEAMYGAYLEGEDPRAVLEAGGGDDG